MHKKQTKIVATISDRKCDVEFLTTLYKNGANVFRLNTAHQSPADTMQVVENIRTISDKIAIMVDTKGPEVRTLCRKEPLSVKTGDIIDLTTGENPENGFAVNYDNFVQDVPVGSKVLIDDAELEMEVVERVGNTLKCRICNDGAIKSRKSVNVPGVQINLPALSQKDRSFVEFCIEQDIDFIAHSFVRSREDVKEIQELLDAKGAACKIIAKIENREGVDNLEEILDVVYGVMVARGDLAVEIPYYEVPMVQKRMIQACIRRVKPVITATQMLHTMIDNPRPTRAEISDVANAVLDGSDAVMLSGETAYGDFPVEAVKTMTAIIKSVEGEIKETRADSPNANKTSDDEARDFLARSAVKATVQLPIQAIIAGTRSGFTARLCASHRGHVPIYALSNNPRTCRELSLCHGVYSWSQEVPGNTDELIVNSVQKLIDVDMIARDELVAIMATVPPNAKQPNSLQIDTPANILD